MRQKVEKLIFADSYHCVGGGGSGGNSDSNNYTRAAAGNAAIPELQLRNAAATYQTENLAISLSVLILYSKIYKCTPQSLTISLSIGID